ncbi:YozE family protein [Bacillus fonticola]|uniref:YozE family protein n=1 Tax=Bacillus fonticola TaxID=2728853 RepID=UPI001475DCE9|nr:YozE family protein [Bacillus fonticola]
MRRSFYHFLMTHRNPKAKNAIQQFANDAYEDHSFPKHTSDYDEVSRYLEEQVDYLPSLAVFDYAWQEYEEIEEKGKR